MEIRRDKELATLADRFGHSPIVALLGPRQCGKTTLAHQFSREIKQTPIHFFDLENPRHIAALENPMLALESLKGIIIIDEIQRRPDLFPVLRVLVDQHPQVKYLILGSASRDLIAQSSETLAGRIAYIEVGGFTLDLFADEWKPLWNRGGFPRSYLAKNEEASYQWREDFIATFLERDLPNLGIHIPPSSLRRFWTMLAHYHGQIFNASEIGKSLGIADTTARHYLDILTGTFLVRLLQPWYYNTKKRIIKRPKIYFRDTGLFHTLLTLKKEEDVRLHPKLGASWEGFALEQTIRHLNLTEEEVYFWAVHGSAELDLLFQDHGKLWGVEVKFHDAPTLTPSIQAAISELQLAHLWVVYPGKENYRLSEKVSVVSISSLSTIGTK